MVTLERPALEQRVLSALDASPARIPVIVGADGSGRTSLLLRLRDELGNGAAQYVDVEGIATTPERFFAILTKESPFDERREYRPSDGTSPREAFRATLQFLGSARAHDGRSATFLLDEALELRTFESFPGLRHVLRDLVSALAQGGNHFVLATRYAARARRLLRDVPDRFEPIPMEPLSPAEVGIALSELGPALPQHDPHDLALAVQGLADGRPSYVTALLEAMVGTGGRLATDPVSALAALMAPGERLFSLCRYQFELRLHRARGYGALKAILGVLADEEPLTLTQIANQLHRTPGSTKDYLSWLEDVDLISVERKRYSFCDPLLRLWMRLHCRAVPPSEDRLASEVQAYTLSRLPDAPDPADALESSRHSDDNGRSWGMMEID